jgi:capsular exopolysaccharide synthesis family protein
MFAESFRSTLVSILFSGENGSRARVLVLTSSSPGEGKSTISTNLAIAIAEVGQRVLLIDGDMRRPRLHDIFGVPNSPGLSDLLRERKSIEEKLTYQGLIRDTGVPGLFLLTGGAGTSTAINLMYRTEITELLKRYREEFDTVLIDTPPMMQIPDARVLGRMADGVILVLRAGRTTRDAAVAARQRLAEDGTRVLGTILNDWNRKSSAGYYGYYHNGYHNYDGKHQK